MKAMVLLVGEQPVPNLLPVLHERPDEVLLVHTQRTKNQNDRLFNLLEGRCRREMLEVSAYDVAGTREILGKWMADKGWRTSQTIFNLTGGTKTMAFAAYELAVRLGSEFLYLQTEGARSLIYRYITSGGAPVLRDAAEEIGPLLTIDDYVRAHLGTYTVTGFSPTEGGQFEKAVYDALRPVLDESVAGVQLGGAVDIDMVFRCGNQVGIAELKTGKPSKEGIGQLTTAGGRAYLGTYTKRFLIVGRSWEGFDDLKDLAIAREITLIELTGYQNTGVLSSEGVHILRQQIGEALRCSQLGSLA